MPEQRILICQKCKKAFEPRRIDFTYLGHSFYTDILSCPGCGQVFIPEELAKGRIAEVEQQLEDK